MKDMNQNAESIAIIGGADGPTSVYVTENRQRTPLKTRIEMSIYRNRRRKAEKKIIAGARTLEELVTYAVKTYGAEKSDRASEENISVYQIKAGEDCLEIEVDYTRDTFGVSFSGNRKRLKYFRKTAKDLYIYYGVSEDDIRDKTERYYSLLGVLSI